MAVSKVLSGVLVVVYMSVRLIGLVFHTDDHARHWSFALFFCVSALYIMQGGVFNPQMNWFDILNPASFK